MKGVWRLMIISAVLAFFASGPVSAQVLSERPVAEIPPASGGVVRPNSAPALVNSSATPQTGSQAPGTQTNYPVQPPTPVVGAPVVAPLAPSPEEVKKQINDAAFEAAASGIMPLSPEQIRELMRRVDTSLQASSAPLHDPRPEIQVATISLDPGVAPPELKVSAGNVTTLTILDQTGQPWPIKTVAVGGSFDVPQPEENGHILRITPLTKFGSGNLSLTLLGLATPITFRLQSGDDVVYYRFDARIPMPGPNAQTPLISRVGQVAAGDELMMNVLDGVPPSGAERLNVSGVDSRTVVWKVGDRVFLRTPLKLLSPAWDASVSSADGTTVYSVHDAPVFLLSDNGVLVRARITLREKLNEY